MALSILKISGLAMALCFATSMAVAESEKRGKAAWGPRGGAATSVETDANSSTRKSGVRTWRGAAGSRTDRTHNPETGENTMQRKRGWAGQRGYGGSQTDRTRNPETGQGSQSRTSTRQGWGGRGVTQQSDSQWDREQGTASREQSWTTNQGQTATRSQSSERTETGFNAQSTKTGPQGASKDVSVEHHGDHGTKTTTWTNKDGESQTKTYSYEVERD